MDCKDQTLYTEHLVLRRGEKSDAQLLSRHLMQYRDSSLYMDWAPMNQLETEAWLAKQNEEEENRIFYVIDEKKGNKAIGFAGLKYDGCGIFEEDGIAVGPDYAGHGYGGEILDALLHLALTVHKGRQFLYGCTEDNLASAALARSRGFVLMKHNTIHFEKDHTDHPHLLFVCKHLI
jgi:RimJ/RimL family protein N-acetyltransferase